MLCQVASIAKACLSLWKLLAPGSQPEEGSPRRLLGCGKPDLGFKNNAITLWRRSFQVCSSGDLRAMKRQVLFKVGNRLRVDDVIVECSKGIVVRSLHVQVTKYVFDGSVHGDALSNGRRCWYI